MLLARNSHLGIDISRLGMYDKMTCMEERVDKNSINLWKAQYTKQRKVGFINMKKRVSIILLLCVVITAFTACGNKSAAEERTQAVSSAQSLLTSTSTEQIVEQKRLDDLKSAIKTAEGKKGQELQEALAALKQAVDALETDKKLVMDFNVLVNDIQVFPKTINTQISTAESLLTSTKESDVADIAVLTVLSASIKSAKAIQIAELPSIANTADEVRVQLDDLNAMKAKLQEQCDLLADSCTSVSQSRQELLDKIAAEKQRKLDAVNSINSNTDLVVWAKMNGFDFSTEFSLYEQRPMSAGYVSRILCANFIVDKQTSLILTLCDNSFLRKYNEAHGTSFASSFSSVGKCYIMMKNDLSKGNKYIYANERYLNSYEVFSKLSQTYSDATNPVLNENFSVSLDVSVKKAIAAALMELKENPKMIPSGFLYKAEIPTTLVDTANSLGFSIFGGAYKRSEMGVKYLPFQLPLIPTTMLAAAVIDMDTAFEWYDRHTVLFLHSNGSYMILIDSSASQYNHNIIYRDASSEETIKYVYKDLKNDTYTFDSAGVSVNLSEAHVEEITALLDKIV